MSLLPINCSYCPIWPFCPYYPYCSICPFCPHYPYCSICPFCLAPTLSVVLNLSQYVPSAYKLLVLPNLSLLPINCSYCPICPFCLAPTLSVVLNLSQYVPSAYKLLVLPNLSFLPSAYTVRSAQFVSICPFCL